jgi:ABC-type phosphate transport system substrate-binding protein
MRKLIRIVVGATALASGAALAIGPAMADPINGSGKAVVPRATDIVSVGSDTSENVFDQFSVDYNKTISSAKPHLYSWDATNAKTGKTDDPIKTKAGCSAIPRPDGATTGIAALQGNTKVPGHKSDYCIDFARSSSGRSTQTKGPGGVVFVELAKDAISWATNAKTNAPANLSTAQLAAIYSCTDRKWSQVGGKSGATIQPFLPPTSSGLRKSFLKDLGVPAGSCVNSSVQQNEGTNKQFKNNANALVPYSVAKYLSQVYRSAKCGKKPTKNQNLFGCDEHGSFVLHSINGTKPTTGRGSGQTINPAFTSGFFNTIYDVVRWAAGTKGNIPAYLEPIFGTSGWLCKNKTAKKDLTNYYLLPSALCGVGV